MANELRKYFGYGANRSQDMMTAIIGRRPNGDVATLYDHELCIQTWDEISPEVREKLVHWDQNFRTYCIRPAKGKKVKGVVWFLTDEERELVENWELISRWYKGITVDVETPDGKYIKVETEMIDDPSIRQVVDGERYQIFLNKEEKMLEVAEKVREEFLEEKGLS